MLGVVALEDLVEGAQDRLHYHFVVDCARSFSFIRFSSVTPRLATNRYSTT